MNIFVSYRRDDSRHIADRMYDRLVSAFGQDSVFKDVDCIPLGVDFRRILQEAVSRCTILLAVIGNRWATIADQAGQRRLENPNDFVRIEVETALHRGIPVVPVLVDGASFPQATDLPPSLNELTFRNGTVVRPDPDFHRDMDRLIKGCKPHCATLLRFDGLYRSEQGGYYARFFEDGLVLTAVTIGSPGQVGSWLIRENQDKHSHSRYTLIGSKLAFSHGAMDLQGIAAGDRLTMDFYSHITGHRGVMEYNFFATSSCA